MDNNYAVYAFHQGIQDQPVICIHQNYFHQLSSHQTYQFPVDLTI